MHEKTKLDINFIRDQFPNIEDCAFFENAGGTLVPSMVSDRVYDYMRRNQVQPAAPYAASEEAQDRIDCSHRNLADMLGVNPKEVVVGHSTTLNVYVLANAIRHWFKPGDEVIVTNLDHEANNGAWRRLEEFGVVIKEWKIDSDTGELGGTQQLEKILTKRTRLVCCTWCSNITGSINDIREITDLVHSAGALICVDAVAFAPHRALELIKSNVDFCVFSLYKLYGPHLGVLYGKRKHLLQLPNQNHYFFSSKALPYKLQPGGYLHETAASIEGICEYINLVHAHHFDEQFKSLAQRYAQVFELFTSHEEEILSPFMEFLNSRRDIRIVGHTTSDARFRVPTVSFTVTGRQSEEFPKRLGEHNIGISSGHFYAKRCIDALRLGQQGGVVRASMVHYNCHAEVRKLISVLDSVL